MNGGLFLLAGALTLVLLLSATINFALRFPSRVRLKSMLRRKGREHLLERLLDTRSDLTLCAATLRTASTLALVMVVLRMCQTANFASGVTAYIVAFFVLLALMLVFSVVVPAAWARYAGENLLAFMLPFLLALHKVLRPLLFLLGVVEDVVRRLAEVPFEDGDDDAARHEQELLDAVSEGERIGAMDDEEKEMIESVMDLRETDAAEIMTPRTEIRAVDKDAKLSDVKDLIRSIGHSRIPVFEETIDKVLGIVYAKDLLHLEDDEPFCATSVMRSAHFIPETKNLRELLHEFQAKKVHMAIVLDEYGGTAGLVTIEDILEELVGEIADEYDPDQPEPMTHLDESTFEVDARVRIEELNEELDIALPEDDSYETLGGFVSSRLGKIPAVGDGCAHENIQIKVIDAEPRRINRLRLHVDRSKEPTDNGR